MRYASDRKVFRSMPDCRTSRFQFLGMALLGILTMACDTGGPPIILQPIANQQAQVGTQMRVELIVLNSGGQAPKFSLITERIGNGMPLGDLIGRSMAPAEFAFFGDTGAYFTWKPLGADVGDYVFRIIAEANGQTDGQNFRVVVRPGSAQPRFLKPMSDQTLNFAQDPCIEFEVVADDPDSARVTLSLEPPLEPNYQLTRTGPKNALFTWCPNPNQLQRQQSFGVNLLADDGDGHQARKSLKIILRQELQVGCPGQSPTIQHTPPESAFNQNELKLSATIADDIRIASVVLYYTFDAAMTSARDLSGLRTVDMESSLLEIGANPVDGVKYNAVVPISPVEGDMSPKLHYFIEATDNDDASGNCDHRTALPKSGFLSVPVSSLTQLQPVEPCGECNSDDVCGDGLCIREGSASFCLPRCSERAPQACDGVPDVGCCEGQVLVTCAGGAVQRQDCGSVPECGWDDRAGSYSCRADRASDPLGRYLRSCGTSDVSTARECAAGYRCQIQASESVDGVSGQRICMPESNSCRPPCIDDAYEDAGLGNDTFESAQNQGYLRLGETVSGLKLCTEGTQTKPDYYGLFIERPGGLRVDLTFSHALGDVDVDIVAMTNQTEERLVRGVTTDDNESICADVQPGNYYLKVYTYDDYIDNQYALTAQLLNTRCDGGPVNVSMNTPPTGGESAVPNPNDQMMGSSGGRPAGPGPGQPIDCQDDAAEEDDSSGLAQIIQNEFSSDVRQICPGDDDWFSIQLNQGESLTVEVLFDHGPDGDLDVEIFRGDGPAGLIEFVQASESSTDDERVVTAPATGPSTYYIRVYGFNGASNDYLIGVDVRLEI